MVKSVRGALDVGWKGLDSLNERSNPKRHPPFEFGRLAEDQTQHEEMHILFYGRVVVKLQD